MLLKLINYSLGFPALALVPTEVSARKVIISCTCLLSYLLSSLGVGVCSMMDPKGVLIFFLVSLAFPFLLSMELQLPSYKLDWNHNQFLKDIFTFYKILVG